MKAMIGLLGILCCFSVGFAADRPDGVKGVDVTEHLGRVISPSWQFVNEASQAVEFREVVPQDRPTVLAMVYFGCPNLCNLVLNGLLKALKDVADWKIGEAFDVIVVSIDPSEKPDLAVKKKNAYLKSYGLPEDGKGFHFLTGEASQSKGLADEVGFGYQYDEKEGQYAHAAVLMLLTPERKISRYLYGVTFEPKTLKLALLEASKGRVSRVVDRMLLFCFHFDPDSNSYVFQIWRVVQVVLGIQALIFASILLYLWKKDEPRTDR